MPIWSVNLNPNRLCPDLSPAGLDAGAAVAFERLAEMGAGGVRVDLFWRWLMPEPGRVDAGAVAWYRRFFAECDRRGLTIVVLLYHPPAWALALDETGFLGAWEDFCRLVAREFGQALPLVQIWNEPNNFLAPLKQDPALFHERRIGARALPVGVRWETLAALFAIARAQFPASTLLVYNVLTNLSPFLPFRGTWLDWEAFTDRFMALAGEHVDVIALDHYPDTWAPGLGPLEWGCLETAAARVADPGSSWYGKTVIIGETGYSSAANFHLIERPFKLGRFFPQERSEATMAAWFEAAMGHLARTLTPVRFPHNRLSLVSVYELFDAPRPVGTHPILKLEDHFGLLRRDGSAKPAFAVMQRAAHGDLAFDPARVEQPEAPFYWRLAGWGRELQARLTLEKVVPKAEARGGRGARVE